MGGKALHHAGSGLCVSELLTYEADQKLIRSNNYVTSIRTFELVASIGEAGTEQGGVFVAKSEHVGPWVRR